MVAAIKWEAAPTARTAIDLGTTLATDVLSAVGAEIDNSANLDTYGWLELATSAGDLCASAVTRAGATADIYMVTALDGTNYSNTPVTADVGEFGNQVGVIALPTEAGIVPVFSGPIALPPCKFKLLLFNNTDQTLQNTWELNLYTDNLESQ
jgi:hypothetical protein